MTGAFLKFYRVTLPGLTHVREKLLFSKVREMSGNFKISQGKIEFWKMSGKTDLCKGKITFPGVHTKNLPILGRLGHQVPIFFFFPINT